MTKEHDPISDIYANTFLILFIIEQNTLTNSHPFCIVFKNTKVHSKQLRYHSFFLSTKNNVFHKSKSTLAKQTIHQLTVDTKIKIQ